MKKYMRYIGKLPVSLIGFGDILPDSVIHIDISTANVLNRDTNWEEVEVKPIRKVSPEPQNHQNTDETEKRGKK